ncbi:hypothetical protein PGH12_05990 [Chryseobacterium wangxinyae]|uniref:hypothetical protein n=1 Tax=Chryseobacterium sp. CY350 TaxID=2997336 RepID=UPI0022713816|nr:hypothetical protein [Chryseobacterium sp. CY350]MCY0976698.1 hypothetical protein [Chryseobacterium sp. CY350]WBZ96699.1 hypothetical protein PGH12_05990 [Chryseobacterium sp. CY350]
MKENLSILFFFISIFSFSQEISFDYLIEKTSVSREKYKSFTFLNSQTNQFLSVSRHNKKFIGSLNDMDEKLLHYFYIYEKDGKYTAVYSDSYPSDSPIKTSNLDSKYANHDNIELYKVDDLNYKVNLFSKNRSKKSRISVDIILEKSEFNFLDIFIDSPERFAISTMLEKEVNKDGCCYRIAKYAVTYRKNNVVSTTNTTKKVELKLIIPDKLNIKTLQSSTS